jgi:hypothetical protein
MSYMIDLGGAPANEECAQLGQTPDFTTVNGFEVFAYKLAVIARHGMPPKGCRLNIHPNHHDFGTYSTLVLQVTDEDDETVQAYADAVEEGLGSWLKAGFTPPVTYHGSIATIVREDPCELVIGALLTTRPNADGNYETQRERFNRNATDLVVGMLQGSDAEIDVWVRVLLDSCPWVVRADRTVTIVMTRERLDAAITERTRPRPGDMDGPPPATVVLS